MPKHGRYVVGRMLVEASRMARAGSSRLEDVSRRYMASEDRRRETNPTTTRAGGQRGRPDTTVKRSAGSTRSTSVMVSPRRV